MNLYDEQMKREMEWQEIRMGLEKLKTEQDEYRKLVKEAAQLDNRTIPFATIEWLDTHQRRHIGPYDTSGKHNQLNLECWCAPTIYQGVIFHWDEP